MNDTNGTSAVATPSAPAAASAPSAPSQSAFAEAFARESSPDSHSPDASTTPPAAAQPGSEQGSPQQPQQERSAFIPRERFDELNTRMQAAEAWKQQHGWAEQVNPQEFQQIQSIARHFASGDIVAGIKSLYAEASKDPTVAAAFRSEAARVLAQRQPQQAPAEPEMVNVQLEDGTIVAMPRDPAAYLAHQKQQWMAELKQELSPDLSLVKDLQAERMEAVRQQQITHFVTTTYDDVKTWPGMESDDAQKAVAEEIGRTRLADPNDPREVSLALNAAYRKVVLPTLGQRTEAKLLDSLKTRAQASASVNPGSAAPSAPQTISRFQDLGPEAWR